MKTLIRTIRLFFCLKTTEKELKLQMKTLLIFLFGQRIKTKSNTYWKQNNLNPNL